MNFHNAEEALHALEDISLGKKIHQEAFQYLADLDACEEVKDLVESLESDDSGVRWQAANMLAEMGDKAISAVLKALMDPKRVGDPRLREGVIHMIHVFDDPELKLKLMPLINTLKSPAPDISTMWEAYHILMAINPKACDEEL